MAQVRVFGFLFRTGFGGDIPNFPAYVFIGVLVWGWLQMSLSLCSNAITGNRELVRRPGFPVAVLPIVILTTNLIDFLLAFPILLVFLVVGGSELTPALLVLPFVMLLQFLLMLGLGYLLATFQVTFRDTTHLLNVLLRLGFFFTPIFYNPAKMLPARYQWLYRLNPIVHLLDAYRAVLLEGTLPAPRSFLILGVLIIILLPFGYKTFIQARYRFLEEL